MEADVFIVKETDSYRATKKLLDEMNFSLHNKKVLIKPNLTTSSSSESGITTDVNAVRAVLEQISDCDVIIGEGSGGADTMMAFEKNGYIDVAKEFDAQIIDFNKDEIIYVDVPKPFAFSKLPIAKTVLDCDYLINMSKLKIHSISKVTLSMKNLFGCVPLNKNKARIHKRINKASVDFLKIMHSDLNIVEGIIGNQSSEIISNPVKSGIVIGGYDAISVDIVGAMAMGVNPSKVKTIKLAQDFFGNRKPIIHGPKIEDVRIRYKTPTAYDKIKQYVYYFAGKPISRIKNFL